MKDTQRGRYGEETEIETHSKTDGDGGGYGEAEEGLEQRGRKTWLETGTF